MLTWLFLAPILSSILVFLVSRARPLAGLLSLISLAILVYNHGDIIGSSVNYPWFPSASIEFHLKVDAISILFLYLSAIIIPITLFSLEISSNGFSGLILFLQGLLMGFFMARDLVMFTIFWEAMLIPLYFIINLWGGKLRQFAALQFLIYMIAGSFLMVAALLALYSDTHSFNMDLLSKVAGGTPHAAVIAAIFFIAFAVKTPLFPFHAWLPDAYCEAPAAGTILLSALLSKAGIYGFLRIGLGMFPQLTHDWIPLFLTLSIAGVLYGAFAAWQQKDYKRLITYSSLSHVNFILIGIFTWSDVAHEGAVLQAFNHGVTITALFLAASWLEKRIGTREMNVFGGLAKFMPHLCWLTLFFVLSAVALPGTNNFVGEIMILLGLFMVNPWGAFFAGLSIILSVIYMLRLMQNVYFQEPGRFQESWVDIKAREYAIAAPLVFLILFLGIYPAPILNILKSAFTEIP